MPRGRVALTVLLLLIAMNAVVAAASFLTRPDGSGLGIPQAWLAGTPFPDYRVPGAILGALGLLHAWAALLQLRRHPRAWFWAGLCGGSMLVWIIVQAALMGSTRHPAQTVLQAFVLAVGAATGLLALRQWRDARGAATLKSPQR